MQFCHCAICHGRLVHTTHPSWPTFFFFKEARRRLQQRRGRNTGPNRLAQRALARKTKMGGKGRAQAKMKIMAKLGENLYRTTKVFGPMWEKQKARAAPRAAPRLRPLQHSRARFGSAMQKAPTRCANLSLMPPRCRSGRGSARWNVTTSSLGRPAHPRLSHCPSHYAPHCPRTARHPLLTPHHRRLLCPRPPYRSPSASAEVERGGEEAAAGRGGEAQDRSCSGGRRRGEHGWGCARERRGVMVWSVLLCGDEA